MKIAISGALYRPGQEGNIAWLWAVIGRFFKQAKVVVVPALTWEAWTHVRLHGHDRYKEIFEDFDYVVGFELPPALMESVQKWVNVKRSPFRWGRPLWSVQASFDHEPLPEELLELPPGGFPGSKFDPFTGGFFCQVSSDASLLDGEKLLTPSDLIEEITRAAERYRLLYVVPHPYEQDGPWVQELLKLPQAKLWTGTGYEALGKLRSMMTINSSTGLEAPHFGCFSTKFFRPPQTYSVPVDISYHRVWEALGLV